MKHVIVAFAVAASSFAPLGISAEPKAAKQVTADQAIACIKLAVAAKAGNVREMEVKADSNRTVCEVEIVATDGKKHEVYVDVAAAKVLRVED